MIQHRGLMFMTRGTLMPSQYHHYHGKTCTDATTLIYTTHACRPMEVADIDEALADSRTLTPDQDQDSTFRRYQTYRNEEDEEGAADIMWSDEWDSTESEESDDEPTLSALVSQLSTGGSDTIPILGSLMLSRESSVIEQQGIFQGLVVDEQDREKMGILPVAVYMTQTLEKFGSQLEDLSVRVTRETEIVPTSPFDFNAPRNGERTKSGKKIILCTTC